MSKRLKYIQTIILSPSGNLYGSEQVLIDFLKCTTCIYLVLIPYNSLLSKELRSNNLNKKHNISYFNKNNLYKLYLYIIALLFFRKINTVYINEGGHIKWINAIASFFPNNQFFVHIRMLEDTSASRLKGLRKNIHLICISKYIYKEAIKLHINTKLIYDPYDFPIIINRFNKKNVPLIEKGFIISIIGRIAISKGLDKFLNFATAFNKNTNSIYFQFNFFGEVTDGNQLTYEMISKLKKLENINIHFRGFVQKEEIYKNSDAVLHLSVNEGLGRIVFESIEHQIPFIGFDAGGIGEIASLLGLSKTIIPYSDNNDWIENLSIILIEMLTNYTLYRKEIFSVRENIQGKFSTREYTHSIEKAINFVQKKLI